MGFQKWNYFQCCFKDLLLTEQTAGVQLIPEIYSHDDNITNQLTLFGGECHRRVTSVANCNRVMKNTLLCFQAPFFPSAFLLNLSTLSRAHCRPIVCSPTRVGI